MSTKVFNTRLQLKYDSWKNWYDNNPTLLAGEIAIVNVPAQTNESTGEVTQKPAILFKVGDGTTDFRTLDWASGLAADVYEWAKAETKPEYTATEISLGDTTVAANIADIWAKLEVLTGEESGNGNSITDMIQSGIEAFAATLGTAAYAATTDFDAAGTAADLIEQFAGTLGTAAYAATTDFDAAGTGATEAAKVLGTDADVAGTATVHGALKSAAAAAKAGTDAAAVVDGKLTEYKTSNDAALAEVKATADNAAVKADVDTAFEGVNATIETLATKADVAASFETVNGEIADINEAIAGINEAAATHATKEELATAKEEASAAAAKALEDAQAYADEIKSDLLGESETLEGTYDTLKEIAGWIATHEGETVVELTTAISDEEAARKAADENFETRVSALEEKVDVEKVSDAIDAGVAVETALREAADTALSNRIKDLEDNKAGYATTAQVATAKQEAIDAASADATSKADAAEADANAYTDEKIGSLHTVATTGKLGDLESDGRATTAEADYVIFYCGTASILTSPEVTE